MWHVTVKATLLSPVTGERLIVEALIDTGATFTTLPKTVAERLNLIEVTRRRVRTASGEEVLSESYVTIEVEDERTTTPVLISEKVDRVLLGVLTLEALAFKVDPKTGKLEKTELLLL
ncbi:MAG: retroviral-like aspartic protease family protein [Nitrososphaerales archaeon]